MSARTVDTRGLVCPLPILELAKAIRLVQPGEEILLLATDVGVRADVPAWCAATGHQLLSLEGEEGSLQARVRKKAI